MENLSNLWWCEHSVGRLDLSICGSADIYFINGLPMMICYLKPEIQFSSSVKQNVRWTVNQEFLIKSKTALAGKNWILDFSVSSNMWLHLTRKAFICKEQDFYIVKNKTLSIAGKCYSKTY